MNLPKIIGLATLCTASSLFASKTTHADLYWCQINELNSALVQQKIENSECRLVSKSSPKKPAESARQQAEQGPRKQGRAGEGEANFPSVSPGEQEARDETRTSILQLELSQESTKLKDLRELIQRNQQDKGNQQIHDFYVQRFKRHAQNIKALRQEIARLP